jgi:molybdopterin-containing oxidoreductase family membrane subunit
VGWYWSRWNINFCGTVIIPSALRMAINRSAEAMTIFSVIQAGLFPIIHMVGVLYYHSKSIWISLGKLNPLLWDVFAISTYLSVSLVLVDWFVT